MTSSSSKIPLSEIVYEDLKYKILNNHLIPGDKLIELEIAKELNVSRTPVREALLKLSEENLVETNPRKSYTVSKFSMRDAKELYTVRSALEPLAVKLLCEEGITERTKDLEFIIEQIKEDYDNKNFESFKKNIIKWNLKLIELTKNRVLKEMLGTINSRLYRYANYIINGDNDVIKDSYLTLTEIFECIKDRDSERGCRASYYYVYKTYINLEKRSNYTFFKYY
ncbi:GntR family transcriptional regulator [Anaerosphaera multitolerans]|uniref:GntR family transcriptional regulator n=1 Tax=Anaerosphaera multitolerans TaxID=2487351 RepID=A0A437S7Z9_9FIRM|nr:GntR family transcriptional regulator [Anaerosphaera multitolerans]RVU55038.1 GntR family transcriptional regulator [Anaerosphaera multitolerans]